MSGGCALTIVLLPPIGLDAGCWPQLACPPESVRAHVLPGFGDRDRRQPRASMADLADEVVATYPGRLDLVGVSMGAMVAQQVAVRHPDRTRSLLSACTGVSVNRDVMEQRARQAEGEGMRAVLDATLPRWFTAAALATTPEPPGVRYARETLLKLDPQAWADGWRTIATHDLSDEISSVTAPTTCLAADGDAASPVERVADLADRIGGATLVVEPGPHMFHLENPEAFASVLAAHLARVEDHESARSA